MLLLCGVGKSFRGAEGRQKRPGSPKPLPQKGLRGSPLGWQALCLLEGRWNRFRSNRRPSSPSRRLPVRAFRADMRGPVHERLLGRHARAMGAPRAQSPGAQSDRERGDPRGHAGRAGAVGSGPKGGHARRFNNKRALDPELPGQKRSGRRRQGLILLHASSRKPARRPSPRSRLSLGATQTKA
jgi:hypothetical protein